MADHFKTIREALLAEHRAVCEESGHNHAFSPAHLAAWAALDALEAGFAERLAEAWSEGYGVGKGDGLKGVKTGRMFQNPYRK